MRRIRVPGIPCQLDSVGQMLEPWRHDAVMGTMRGAHKSVLRLFKGR